MSTLSLSPPSLLACTSLFNLQQLLTRCNLTTPLPPLGSVQLTVEEYRDKIFATG